MTQQLTDDQRKALDIMSEGYNCFLTSNGAGCGKSYLLNIFIKSMRERGKNVIVTASTGCAAVHINGSTFHSVNKLGLGKDDVKILTQQMKRNKKVSKMWRESNILIIEEISMLDTDYFEKMSQVIADVRGNINPFGGIQVILCGDMLQLPAINCKNMIFEGNVWKNLKMKNLLLTTIVRQQDKEFISILQELRFGKMTHEIFKYLEARCKKHDNEDILKLYPLRKDVDAENLKKLNKIESPEKVFEAKFGSTCSDGIVNSKNYEALEKDMVARRHLVLKIGAKVLYLVNNSAEKLYNGIRGTIIGFEGSYPIVKFRHKEVVVTPHSWRRENSEGTFTFTQLPLLCCWSLSVHKCQGFSLDEAEIDLGKSIFESGQAYVALSRIRSIDGVYISSLDKNAFICNPKAKKFYEELKSDI